MPDSMNPVKDTPYLVSVVIPLFNGAKYIRRSVRSVLNQSYGNFELIVVDDGSTDGGGDLALEFTDQRLRLVRQENAGVSAARNRGIEESRSRYIAFLDADDEWDAGFLDAVVSLSNDYPSAGMFGTGYRLVFPAGPGVEVTVEEAARQVASLLVTDYFYRTCGGSFIHVSGVMIPKAIFEELGGFLVGEHYGEDNEMWARIALRYPIAYNTQILSSFFQTAMDDKPRFKKVQKYDRKVRMLEEYLTEAGDSLLDHRMIRSHVKIHLIEKCFAFISVNDRDSGIVYMYNSNARNWIPLLSLLFGYPPVWPFLRLFALIKRFCCSRMGMKMVGGKRTSYGVLERLQNWG